MTASLKLSDKLTRLLQPTAYEDRQEDTEEDKEEDDRESEVETTG